MMAYDIFSSLCMSPLVRLHNRVNVAMHKNLLEHVPVLQNSGFENHVFMQDNASCNKVKQVIAYLNDQGINVMDWPAQVLT